MNKTIPLLESLRSGENSSLDAHELGNLIYHSQMAKLQFVGAEALLPARDWPSPPAESAGQASVTRTRICGLLSYNNSEICVSPSESPWKEAKKGRKAGSKWGREGRTAAKTEAAPGLKTKCVI